MAPDLNSISPFRPSQPPFPSQRRASVNTRRLSNQMSSQPSYLTSPTTMNILPSNQSVVTNTNPMASTASSSSSSFATSAESQSIAGPGPLRHPRPITAAELHMELEQEQEAVVNRLTRELSLLRASQNASVASNTSSTSANSNIHHDTHDSSSASTQHSTSTNTIPSRRHQRSGSSTSIRSISGASVTNENIAGVAPERPRSIMYRHDSNTHIPPPMSSHERISMSRQNSTNSTSNHIQPLARSTSGTSSPDYIHHTHPHHSITRPSLPTQPNRERSESSILNREERLSSTSIPTSARLDEILQHKHELDKAKKENEMLRLRIRELEALVRRNPTENAGSSI